MNVRRSTPARARRRKTPTEVPQARRPPQIDLEFPLLPAYQQQIAELEGTITHLRQRLMELQASSSELLQSQTYLTDLFQNAPVGYIIHDDAGFISKINHTGRLMFGVKKYARLLSVAEWLREDQLSAWLEHLRRAKTVFHARTELFLGERSKFLPVQLVTSALQPVRGVKSFRTVIIDISQQRATEIALAKTHENYHRLIDTIEGIVWEAEAHTLQVTFVSNYAQRLLGYPAADWKRPGFWQNRIYVDDRDRVANELARAVAQRQPLRIDYRVVNVNRQIVWLHDNITTLERNGEIRLLGVAVDATEQHETQDKLLRNHELLEQRVEERTTELRRTVNELDLFSYSISHDLRAPVRTMVGFAEVALRVGGETLSPRVQECLHRVIEGGVRADRLVQDVLAYSRVSRDKFQLSPLDLDRLVREVVAQAPDFRPPNATVQVQNTLLPVLGHEALLVQCISNLLSNAVKFMPKDVLPQVQVWTEGFRGSRTVRLWVRDNGVGIDSRNIGRIFNMFERIHSQDQYPGTGIGLAIVRKAAERMGGSVGVESEPGKGSKFWVQLQAA